jgi:hypothetical protein
MKNGNFQKPNYKYKNTTLIIIFFILPVLYGYEENKYFDNFKISLNYQIPEK